MSNQRQKFKPVRKGDKESDFEKKVEETREILDLMNRGSGGDKSKTTITTRRMKEQRENENATRMSRDGGKADLVGVGNMTNNINVNIKYTVNQNFANSNNVSRRRDTKKSQNSLNDPKRMQEIMNSSVSKMLDQQLLAGSESRQGLQPRNVSSNAVTDSLTGDIFHGDKIYLKAGQMAYKPLGIETVLQPLGKNKIRTTEQNIASQQRLDQSSVEDFISR